MFAWDQGIAEWPVDTIPRGVSESTKKFVCLKSPSILWLL